MNENAKNFLDKLQSLQEDKDSIYIFSNTKKITVSPLNFRQQKDLVSTVVDGPIGTIKFQKILNDIISENVDNGGELFIYDKLPITISLRIQSLGNVLKIEDKELNLATILDKTKGTKLEKTKTIKTKDLTVNLSLPTINMETRVIQACIDDLKKIDFNAETSKTVGIILVYDIVKLIESLEIGEDVLVMKDIRIQDRVKIVENLPASVNNTIIEFHQKYRKFEKEYLTVEDNVFELDVNLFDS